MNKLFLTLLTAGLMLPAIGAETKALPAPCIKGGMPLMEAIDTRQSKRDYDPAKAVDDQTLGEILWVAWGMNSHGKRTIPTSRNLQNMQLYVLTPTGAWQYDGPTHSLTKVTEENLIPHCNKQAFVPNAPVHLVYAIKDDRGGMCHVGSAYQNVYLYCTSKGLSTVIRAMIDAPALAKGLKLPADHLVVAHQCIGHAK